MKIFRSKAALAAVVATSFILHSAAASAGNIRGWTTTNQPRVQQPGKPLVSVPAPNSAQTVQPQPGTWTNPGDTSSPTVSTPAQQPGPSRPRAGPRTTPRTGFSGMPPQLSIAQDECVVLIKANKPFPGDGGFATGSIYGYGDATSVDPGDALSHLGDLEYGKTREYVVLEKGDYVIMYRPELLYLQNLHKNNPVEFLVRITGIQMPGSGPDDWTRGSKRRSILSPGEMASFDDGRSTALIKVRCP